MNIQYQPSQWPYLMGLPQAKSLFKQSPEDFCVSEIPGFDFSGSGDHLCIQVEKINLNTRDVVDQLKTSLNLKEVDIGYFGLKDKQAVTNQWFSLHTPGKADEVAKTIDSLGWSAGLIAGNGPDSGSGFRILESIAHNRKIRSGTHKFNRFKIVLRDVSGDRETVVNRIEQLSLTGFPNYFGEQRFGLGGRNLSHATTLFQEAAGDRISGARPRRKKISRVKRSLYLSAARSYLFNLVLAERLRMGTWIKPESKEPLVLEGSRSFFEYDGKESTLARIKSLDIHTSGPLWGRAAENALSIEQEFLVQSEVFRTGLERAGLQMSRRALRASVSNLSHQWIGPNTLELDFRLRAGCYATSFLRELVNFE